MIGLKTWAWPSAAAVLLGGVATGAIATPAAAQGAFARDRNVSVTERPRPEYAGRGLRTGAFEIRPTLESIVVFDDNVLRTDEDEESDVAVDTVGRINVASLWSRHRLAATASVGRLQYFDQDDDSVTEAEVAVNGRLDVTRSGFLDGQVRYFGRGEARGGPSSPNQSDEPIDINSLGVDLGGTYDFNRLRLRGQFNYLDDDYDDGLTADGVQVVEQDFRDLETFRLGARADYAVSPDTALFVSGEFNTRRSTQEVAGFVTRDSDGFTALVGANFDLTRFSRGEIGVGFFTQDFDDPNQPTADGFSVDAEVEWFPTQLTTVTFEAARDVQESGLAQTASFVELSTGVQVDYEVLRNLIVTGEFSYSQQEFELITREDERFGAGLSGTLLLNRNLGLVGYYAFTDRDSSGDFSGRTFQSNRIGLGLRAQY